MNILFFLIPFDFLLSFSSPLIIVARRQALIIILGRHLLRAVLPLQVSVISLCLLLSYLYTSALLCLFCFKMEHCPLS